MNIIVTYLQVLDKWLRKLEVRIASCVWMSAKILRKCSLHHCIARHCNFCICGCEWVATALETDIVVIVAVGRVVTFDAAWDKTAASSSERTASTAAAVVAVGAVAGAAVAEAAFARAAAWELWAWPAAVVADSDYSAARAETAAGFSSAAAASPVSSAPAVA